MRTEFHIRRAESAAAAAEQLWPEDVDKHILAASEFSHDKKALITRLLESREPSVRAEGIAIAAQNPGSVTSEQIELIRKDNAGNQYMETNSQLAERLFKTRQRAGN